MSGTLIALLCLRQVGKGRDVGLGQITGFVAKISMGNGMQARSREVSHDFYSIGASATTVSNHVPRLLRPAV